MNSCIPYQNKTMVLCTPDNGATCHSYTNHHLKRELIHYTSLSAMLNPSCSSTNQELFEKHFCNQSSHYKIYRKFSLLKGSYHMLPTNQDL